MIRSKLQRFVIKAAIVCGVASMAARVEAITINLVYRAPGQNLEEFGTAGSAPATIAGGGDLQTIMRKAADYGQTIYGDSHTLTIYYGWYPRDVLATHRLRTEGGSPHRETSAGIAFDNDGTSNWYMDPNPNNSTEWTNYAETTSNLGGGTINVSRKYTGATGDASGRTDLLTVALHEIGHALGLSGSNNAWSLETFWDDEIDVTSPRAFPNTKIPSVDGHVGLSENLMKPSVPGSTRKFPAVVDILANAQISKWATVNYNPVISP